MNSTRELLIIAGWFISLWISYHAFNRAEVYRAKDKIIDRIDKMHEWIVKEIKSIKNDEDKIKMIQIVESFTASKLSQLELSASQYNKFVQYEVVDLNLILQIRNIDLIEGNIEETIKALNDSIYNLSESIEINFSKFANDSIFIKLSNRYHDLKAICFSLVSLWFLFQILKFYF